MSLRAGIFVLLSMLAPCAFAADTAGIEFFEARVRPILVERCYKCHSATSPKLKAGLRLDTFEGMRRGGESGNPSVVPGNLEDSQLIMAVRQDPDGLSMPPKSKLPAEQIALLEQWVKMGAPYPKSIATAAAAPHPVKMTLAEGRKFWTFVPPREQKVPEIKSKWARNEIDQFVLAKLAEQKLTPAPEADCRTLIRRATYDLIGLPPTADEISSFEKDPSPDAYEKLIDRLLASPRYGEKWARHWLDVARYADTKGYVFEEERRYAFSFTYRDWVIRAFNEDLPYDQFLIQQIAADRLKLGEDKRPLAAMGFLTLGRRFINNQTDIIDDRIDVVCRGTMGLTVTCARCHDHKYDPIPTADYYSLYGVFASTKEPEVLPLLGVVEKNAATAEYDKKIAAATKARDEWIKTRHAEMVKEMRSAEQIKRYLLAAQKGVTKDQQLDVEVVDDGKTPVKWMVARWEKLLKESAAKNDTVFSAWRTLTSLKIPDLRPGAWHFSAPVVPKNVNPLVLGALIAASPKSSADVADIYAKILAQHDRAEKFDDPNAEALRLILRSDDSPTNVLLADAIQLSVKTDQDKLRLLQFAIDTLSANDPGSPPRAMAMEDLPTPIEPYIFKRGNAGNPGDHVPRQFPAILSPDNRKPFTDGSGRLELARAIASKQNPLTARVMVNRIWQHHFSFGLVRTPSDFGSRGDRPTHPELLDFLALKFENDDAWSIKKLHKRIMLSATYRQASYGGDARGDQLDPENRLLWHMNPRRLDFEEMRDSLLVATGQLDCTMGGRGVDIFAEPFSHRRSIYAFIERQNLPGTFRTFDFASPDTHQSQRPNTSVPQQALYMMNSPFVINQAKSLGEKSSASLGDSNRITHLYRAVIGRAPTSDELRLAAQFIHADQGDVPPPPAPSVWTYGFGEYDPATSSIKQFHALTYFTGTTWQGGPVQPDPKTGWAMLMAIGGHPGNDQAHAVVRRFTAPKDCTVSVAGHLQHRETNGDGIRARIITTRDKTLATWELHTREAATRITPINLKKNETIDFAVDCRGSFEFDSFEWKVTISTLPTNNAAVDQGATKTWDSMAEFSGPAPTPAKPLNSWQRFAQVLLESNEFMFID